MLMSTEPFTYSVRYRVGTTEDSVADDASQRLDASQSAGLSMWGDANLAAQSRRRNPYIDRSARYIEYDEDVEPKRVAQLVMRTREQLAAERDTAASLRSSARGFARARGFALALSSRGVWKTRLRSHARARTHAGARTICSHSRGGARLLTRAPRTRRPRRTRKSPRIAATRARSAPPRAAPAS